MVSINCLWQKEGVTSVGTAWLKAGKHDKRAEFQKLDVVPHG